MSAKKLPRAAALVVVTVGLAMIAVHFARRVEPAIDATVDEIPEADAQPEEPVQEIRSAVSRHAAIAMDTFSDDGLIDDPDCRFRAGTGPASDTVLFVLQGMDEGRFLVRDRERALFGDVLPFVPRIYSVGERTDGGVLVVLGDMRVHDGESHAPRLHGHARVYLDGQVIFEHEQLWDFGVASDGSSFYAVEPLAGETSRLVLRNLDVGEEHHFDLGRRMTSFDNHGRPYEVHYSSSMSEVVLAPVQELNNSPRGTYWFYAADGSGPRVVRIGSVDLPVPSDAALSLIDQRKIRVEPILHGGALRAHLDRVHFVSSELAYHLVDHSQDGSAMFEVRKSAYGGYGDDEGPQRTDIWSWKMHGSHPHGLVVSDNGSWVALEDRHRIWALDADTGELVFAFPTARDLGAAVRRGSNRDPVLERSLLDYAYQMAALERLRNVLGPDARVGHVGGRSGELRLRGDRLMVRRHFGQGPQTRYFDDVFDLPSASVEGSPPVRIPAIRDCRSAAEAASLSH